MSLFLNVNLMSYAFCAKAAVPLMRRNKGGAIVNVASGRSVVAGGGNRQYDTTKAAVAGLTRALAADHSPFQSAPSGGLFSMPNTMKRTSATT
jgi:NAD(P)-dependent dehydrogenase (short-subunit alcohol dehydrogenase family)